MREGAGDRRLVLTAHDRDVAFGPRDATLEAGDANPQCSSLPPDHPLRRAPARRTPFRRHEVSDKIAHATEADFDQLVLQSDVPVLVDFWAPWCGPCKMIGPFLDQLADEYDGKAKIVKVNVDNEQRLGMRYNARSIPMLLVFKGGQVHGTQIGAVGKPHLAKLIDSAL